MKNNIKVATALLRMHAGGVPLTASAVASETGVHVTDTGNFLRYWAAAGWLEKQREGIHMIFSVTEKGEEGFAALIDKS